jgi:hypothetical protein
MKSGELKHHARDIGRLNRRMTELNQRIEQLEAERAAVQEERQRLEQDIADAGATLVTVGRDERDEYGWHEHFFCCPSCGAMRMRSLHGKERCSCGALLWIVTD